MFGRLLLYVILIKFTIGNEKGKSLFIEATTTMTVTASSADIDKTVNLSTSTVATEAPPTVTTVPTTTTEYNQRIDYGELKEIESGSKVQLYSGTKLYFIGHGTCSITVSHQAYYTVEKKADVTLSAGQSLQIDKVSSIRFGPNNVGIITFTGPNKCPVALSKYGKEKIEDIGNGAEEVVQTTEIPEIKQDRWDVASLRIIIPVGLVLLMAAAGIVKTENVMPSSKLQTTLSDDTLREHFFGRGHWIVLPRGESIKWNGVDCRFTSFSGALLKTPQGILPMSSLQPFTLSSNQYIHAPKDGRIQFTTPCLLLVSPGARDEPGEIEEKEQPPVTQTPEEDEEDDSYTGPELMYIIYGSLVATIVGGIILAGIVGLIACSICSCIVAKKEADLEEGEEEKWKTKK